MNVAILVQKLIDAGTPADIAAQVICEAFVQGAASAPKPVDEQAERRRAADRARKSAERLRNSADSADTPSLDKEIPPNPPKKLNPPPKEKDPKGSQKKRVNHWTDLNAEPFFDEFRAEYPKRAGSDPREPARLKFIAALRSGVPPQTIIDGAAAYRRGLEADGKVGTEFVAQGATWLNQRRWQDDYAASRIHGPSPPVNPLLAALDRALPGEPVS